MNRTRNRDDYMPMPVDLTDRLFTALDKNYMLTLDRYLPTKEYQMSSLSPPALQTYSEQGPVVTLQTLLHKN